MEQGHRWVPVMTRIRFKRKAALKARLDLKAQQLHDEAESCPPGHKRDSLLKKAKQNEIASDIIRWLTSPGPAWCSTARRRAVIRSFRTREPPSINSFLL